MKTSGMSVSNRLTAALLAIALVGPLSCSNQGKNTKWSSRDQSIVPTTNQPANLGTVADSGPRLKVQNPNLKAAAIEVLEQGSVSERSLMRDRSETLPCSSTSIAAALRFGFWTFRRGPESATVPRLAGWLVVGTMLWSLELHLVFLPWLEQLNGPTRAIASRAAVNRFDTLIPEVFIQVSLI